MAAGRTMRAFAPGGRYLFPKREFREWKAQLMTVKEAPRLLGVTRKVTQTYWGILTPVARPNARVGRSQYWFLKAEVLHAWPLRGTSK
jgi:hypothetical protein